MSPRIDVEHVATGRTRVLLRREGASWHSEPCELAVYLNGARIVRRLDVREVGVERLVPERDLSAIEVFEAEAAPVGVPAGCGALMLWSYRRRRNVDLEFAGRLEGRVLRVPGGTPVEGVEVRLQPGDGHTNTDASGHFTFPSLPPALYELRLEVPNAPVWTAVYPVRAGLTTDVDIEVTAVREHGPSSPARRNLPR